MAAAVKSVKAPADLTLGNDVYLQTTHSVQSLLNSELTQHSSASRLTFLEFLLLLPPNLHLKCCNILNPGVITRIWWRPASGQRGNNVPFCDITSLFTRHPYADRNLILFVDGSYCRNGKRSFRDGDIMLLPPNVTKLKVELTTLKLNSPNEQSSMALPEHASYQDKPLYW